MEFLTKRPRRARNVGNISHGGEASREHRQKKPGRLAPEQQRQEENGDAAALASHVPNIQTSEMPASSKNFFGTFTARFSPASGAACGPRRLPLAAA
jgi:hypothetical protein